MKNNFISIVQKCICIDFLLNSLLSSNYYNYLNLLSNIKKENLRNVKILCYLYEYLYKDVLVIEDINSIKLNKSYRNPISKLLEFNLNIINALEQLKIYSPNIFYSQIINGLISSYFNFTSYINCINSINSSQNNSIISKANDKLISNTLPINKFTYFNIYKKSISNNSGRSVSIDQIRSISIDAIKYFFDFSLLDNNINDESYETFFDNDPENKFYQYFFKSFDRRFKVRIWNKDPLVFYLYQSLDNGAQVVPSMSKEDAKNFCDTFIREKLNDDLNNLSFDDNYLNIYSYMNIPEFYKFKYNLRDEDGKINLSKGIYITVDAKYINISELSIF